MIFVTEHVIATLIISFLDKPPYKIKAKRSRQKKPHLVGTGTKFSVHKTFIRHPGRYMNVLRASYIGRVSTEHFIEVYHKIYSLQNPCFGEWFYFKLTSYEAES